MAKYKVRIKEGDKIVEREIEADRSSAGAEWLLLFKDDASGREVVASFRSEHVISAEKTEG